MPHPRKYIAHLDLDCFFVSVERIKNPSLIGRPVVVGGSPSGRGVVASASYEARVFGVRSAMPTGRALQLCPGLIVAGSRHHEYGEISDRLYKRMCELAPVVERASIDEMYLDFTGCESLYANDLPGFIRSLQCLVREEFSLPCSIALASNKTVAKIAVGTVKPAGICVVPHGEERAFLAPLAIEAIPGVGKKTAEVLRGRGIALIADIQALSPERCIQLLGKHGDWIHRAACGEGNALVRREYVRKSISREETFSHDIADRGELEEMLYGLVEDVCSSMRAKGWRAETIGLKLRYANFRTITRAKTVDPTDDDPIVFRVVRNLFRGAYDGRMAVRLLGVHLSNFDEGGQLELSLSPGQEKRDQILHAVDALRERFGDGVIHIGGA